MNKTVTMRSLGSNGRFGNQIFQYAFLRYYQKQYNIEIETPDWIGQEIFDIKPSKICNRLPQLSVESKEQLDAICKEFAIFNVDFWGYFQNVNYFKHDKDFFYDVFTPKYELLAKLQKAWAPLSGKDVLGLHMRYGDYGYAYFYETPHKIVTRHLDEIWEKFENPILYLATDDVRSKKLFKRFSPITARDIFIDLPPSIEFYQDFWALTQVNAELIIANSSFSFAAAMLNKNTKITLRPSLDKNALVKFDAWNDEILLHETNNFLTLMSKLPTMRKYINYFRRFLQFYYTK